MVIVLVKSTSSFDVIREDRNKRDTERKEEETQAFIHCMHNWWLLSTLQLSSDAKQPCYKAASTECYLAEGICLSYIAHTVGTLTITSTSRVANVTSRDEREFQTKATTPGEVEVRTVSHAIESRDMLR